MTTPLLLDPLVPAPFALAGAGVVFWTGRGRSSARKMAVAFAGSLAAVVVLGFAIRIQDRVGSSFPRSFFLWAALPVWAAVVGLLPRIGRRRLAALVAAVSFLVFGAGEVNAHYGYRPNVRDLLGMPLPDTVRRRGGDDATTPTTAPPSNHAHGELVSVDLPGTTSGFTARQALVWLPPRWFDPTAPRLPVVMLLGGVPGEPADLIRGAGAVELGDHYAATHHGLAPILVFADENGSYLNDSECVDGPRGNAETYLTADVPSAVIQRFRAASAPAAWAIGGYSEGGTCAVTLALRHPDLFGAFVDVSGDTSPYVGAPRHDLGVQTVHRLYGGDRAQATAHDAALLAPLAPTTLHGWLVAGTDDRHALHAEATLAAGFAAAGADVQSLTEPGGHSFYLARAALAAALPPLFDRLDASITPTTGPTESPAPRDLARLG